MKSSIPIPNNTNDSKRSRATARRRSGCSVLRWNEAKNKKEKIINDPVTLQNPTNSVHNSVGTPLHQNQETAPCYGITKLASREIEAKHRTEEKPEDWSNISGSRSKNERMETEEDHRAACTRQDLG